MQAPGLVTHQKGVFFLNSLSPGYYSCPSRIGSPPSHIYHLGGSDSWCDCSYTVHIYTHTQSLSIDTSNRYKTSLNDIMHASGVPLNAECVGSPAVLVLCFFMTACPRTSRVTG
ncbi:hypothetical protein FKM82_029636 [Ascaphus truei]